MKKFTLTVDNKPVIVPMDENSTTVRSGQQRIPATVTADSIAFEN